MRKILRALKRAHAELDAPVQAKTARISTNVTKALITAQPVLSVQILLLVSLAKPTADILASQEKDQLVETRIPARATDVHSRTSTNVQTRLTTVPQLKRTNMEE